MAEVDAARRWVRLTGPELAVATIIAIDPEHANLARPEVRGPLEALERAGVTGDGRMVAWIGELLAVVAAPALRIVVETSVGAEILVHSVWATPQHAVLGTPVGEDVTELSPVEPVMLPWEIARTVGLGRRRPAPGIPPIRVPASVIDTVSEQLAGGAVDAAAGTLRQRGLDDAQADALVQLLEQRRLSWRASSVWTGPGGERQTRTVTVVDSGDAGLWRSVVDDVDAPDSLITIMPARASEVWRRIVALMPPPRRKEGTHA